MKVLVLTLLIIAVAFAIPVELDSTDESQLTLADIENEESVDESTPTVARSKRFILKKIALLKAGALGVGALGLAGVVASKNAGGGGFGGNQISQGYGRSYGYNSAQSLSTSYPSTYVASQTYVPQQPQYVPQQPQYVAQPPQYVPQQPAYIPQQPSFGGPINSALAWKAGLANNLVSGIGGGFASNSASYAAPATAYSYGAPPPSAGQIATVPNKPLYVVCDNNN